jgi:hypothetical protein
MTKKIDAVTLLRDALEGMMYATNNFYQDAPEFEAACTKAVKALAATKPQPKAKEELK